MVKAAFLAFLVAFALIKNAASVPRNRVEGLQIVTSPSGPLYPAATWIRLACKQNHPQPSILHYNWIGSCSSRNKSAAAFTISDPLIDDNGWAVMWIKTTPVDCLDTFRCVVYENEDFMEISSGEFILHHRNIYGVGIALSDSTFLGSVPNNSAVVFDHLQSVPQQVICHSSTVPSCQNNQHQYQWLGVDRVTVLGSNDCSNGTFHSTILKIDNLSKEGIYNCEVLDEHGMMRRLFVGIYRSVPEMILKQTYHTTTSNDIVLVCNTSGFPSTTALWSKDGELIIESGNVERNALVNRHTTAYRNTLRLNERTFGLISCNIYGDWLATDRSNSGRQRKEGFFVLAPLSENVNLKCSFPEGTTQVKWIVDESGPFMPISRRPNERENTATISLSMSVESHGQTYTCRGQGDNGVQVERQFLVLARVPASELNVSIESNTPVIGKPLNMRCCVSHAIQDFPLLPTVQWLKNGQLLTQNSTNYNTSLQGFEEGQKICSCMKFQNLTTFEGGNYVCRGSLQTASMDTILMKEENFTLEPQNGL